MVCQKDGLVSAQTEQFDDCDNMNKQAQTDLPVTDGTRSQGNGTEIQQWRFYTLPRLASVAIHSAVPKTEIWKISTPCHRQPKWAEFHTTAVCRFCANSGGLLVGASHVRSTLADAALQNPPNNSPLSHPYKSVPRTNSMFSDWFWPLCSRICGRRRASGIPAPQARKGGNMGLDLPTEITFWNEKWTHTDAKDPQELLEL